MAGRAMDAGGVLQRSGSFPDPNLSEQMGLSDFFRVLADLFAHPDHRLVNTDTVELKIPIPWAGRYAPRDIEHSAGALKKVLVGQASIRRVAFRDGAR